MLRPGHGCGVTLPNRPAAAPGTRNRRRSRRWAALIVVAAVVAGAAGWAVVFREEYPCPSSKGVGLGWDLDRAPPFHGDPQEALRAMAASAPAMTANRIPADGWIEHRGRWIHDMPGNSFYEVQVTETQQGGWFATSLNLCTR